MYYSLQNILPYPLREQPRTHTSDIWETNCTLEKGKKYLISAPSGKGKSTFLHILYGLRKDFSGAVELNEQPINSFSVEKWADLRKDNLAIVFQDLRLFPKLSAMENIQLKARLHGTQSESDIQVMAKRLDVQQLLNQRCDTLSYGQRQRIAIIRALCQPFDFLLLDEPFSHLDEGNTKAAFDLIEQRCAEQKTGFLLVSLGETFGRKYDEELIL
ncbi:MAG: ATP-binding cassette domain-containing protein [Bacteroidota bacterium]